MSDADSISFYAVESVKWLEISLRSKRMLLSDSFKKPLESHRLPHLVKLCSEGYKRDS